MHYVHYIRRKSCFDQSISISLSLSLFIYIYTLIVCIGVYCAKELVARWRSKICTGSFHLAALSGRSDEKREKRWQGRQRSGRKELAATCVAILFCWWLTFSFAFVWRWRSAAYCGIIGRHYLLLSIYFYDPSGILPLSSRLWRIAASLCAWKNGTLPGRTGTSNYFFKKWLF